MHMNKPGQGESTHGNATPKKYRAETMGKQNPRRAEYLGGNLSSAQPAAQHHLQVHPGAHKEQQIKQKEGSALTPLQGIKARSRFGREMEFLEATKASLFLQKSQELLQQTS